MRIQLEKIEFGIKQVLSKYFLDSSVCSQENFITQNIEIEIRGFLFGESHKEIIIEYPDGWWQSTKQKFFPEWLLKIYPVRNIRHVISRKTIYPDIKPSLPKYTNYLIVEDRVDCDLRSLLEG